MKPLKLTFFLKCLCHFFAAPPELQMGDDYEQMKREIVDFKAGLRIRVSWSDPGPVGTSKSYIPLNANFSLNIYLKHQYIYFFTLISKWQSVNSFRSKLGRTRIWIRVVFQRVGSGSVIILTVGFGCGFFFEGWNRFF